MTRSTAILTVVAGCVVFLSEPCQAQFRDEAPPAATGQPLLVPELGEADDAPAEPDVQTPENLPAETSPRPTEVQIETPRQRAIVHIARAEQRLAEGRYEAAVRKSSQAIAVDPDNRDEYRQVRAAAYLALGRYEEALADDSPLEVTVVAPGAPLKSGRNVVATVPAGTKLAIDSVERNWLKVASAGDQQFEWAWVHRRDVRPAPRGINWAPEAAGVGRPGIAIEIDPRYLWRFERDLRYGDPVPPDGYDYYREGPGGDYGRRWHDWWQHVPPRYWRYLPR